VRCAMSIPPLSVVRTIVRVVRCVGPAPLFFVNCKRGAAGAAPPLGPPQALSLYPVPSQQPGGSWQVAGRGVAALPA
jgi:hypothetical protein